MYTCTHCKRKFDNEPFIAYPNKKKYCSLKCIPDSAMDRPYSYEYFSFIESIQNIEAGIKNITGLKDRLELENEVIELSNSLTNETYGDDEGLFYKRQLMLLSPILDKLYSKVHNIFMEKAPELRPAVLICWDSLIQLLGPELGGMVLEYFESSMSGIAYNNVYYLDPTYSSELGYFEDKLCVNTPDEAEKIKSIYISSVNYFKSLYTEKQLEKLDYIEDYVYLTTLAHCVV